MNHFFYSLISFIVALFFILLGIIAVIVSWSQAMLENMVEIISDNSLMLSLFGIGAIIIGLAIAANIIINAKRKYYRIRSGDHSILVDETVIQQYLNAYWKEIFPDNDIPSRLALKGNKIYISVDFPHVPLGQQPLVLEKIKQDLRSKFADLIGYHNEFYLSSTFQANSKPNDNSANP